MEALHRLVGGRTECFDMHGFPVDKAAEIYQQIQHKAKIRKPYGKGKNKISITFSEITARGQWLFSGNNLCQTHFSYTGLNVRGLKIVARR